MNWVDKDEGMHYEGMCIRQVKFRYPQGKTHALKLIEMALQRTVGLRPERMRAL